MVDSSSHEEIQKAATLLLVLGILLVCLESSNNG